MSWDAPGAIAELLGAVGVIASLVHLAGEIRQSREQVTQDTKLSTASATAATFQSRAGANEMLIQDPEVSRIYCEGIADRDSLAEGDQRRFDALLLTQIESRSQDYFFHRQGVSSIESWQMAEVGIAWILEQPGYQQWWRLWKISFSSEFQDYIDGQLRDRELADSKAMATRG